MLNMCSTIVFFCAFVCIYGQKITPEDPVPTDNVTANLHSGLTERIGNFSVELLYFTTKNQEMGQNLIMSPITVWAVLAVISEGAAGFTAMQLNDVLRITKKHKKSSRIAFQNIYQWLQVNTNTVELAQVNNVYLDKNKLLLTDYQNLVQSVYKAKVTSLDFSNGEKTANEINREVSQLTHGRIPKLVDSSDFSDTQMVLTSGVYFKGQWSVPFNASSTTKMPFYNSTGHKIGDVNMMYNRFTYPFSNMKALQARVIELPYGKENRLSMLILLPHPGVSLENMFFNFARVPLDTVFSEMRMSKEEYGDDEVDIFIPRFKIESSLDLFNVLNNSMGVPDMFDESRADFPFMARVPMYVSKVIHKAEIEVTEEGTTASGVTAAEFSNRIGIVQFQANRPFCFLIIEKVTNSIVFGGVYQTPTLY